MCVGTEEHKVPDILVQQTVQFYFGTQRTADNCTIEIRLSCHPSSSEIDNVAYQWETSSTW